MHWSFTFIILLYAYQHVLIMYLLIVHWTCLRDKLRLTIESLQSSSTVPECKGLASHHCYCIPLTLDSSFKNSMCALYMYMHEHTCTHVCMHMRVHIYNIVHTYMYVYTPPMTLVHWGDTWKQRLFTTALYLLLMS